MKVRHRKNMDHEAEILKRISLHGKDKWQTWCMHRIEDPGKVIRFHSCPQGSKELHENKMENELHMEEQILEVTKLYDDGDYTECKRKLLDMLDQEPGFGRAHDLLGWMYYVVLDDLESAENHLRMAVKFAPKYTQAYYRYAHVLKCMGREKELMELTAQGLKTEGVNKCLMHLERGRMLEMRRKYNEALKSYYEAERFAITEYEVEEVCISIKRVIKKSVRPFKRIWLALIK